MNYIKISLITVLTLGFAKDIFSQSGWVQQNSGTNVGLVTIDMVNENTGFVGGGNRLLKTTDGGVTWNQIALCSYSRPVRSISFIDENTGFFSTGAGYPPPPEDSNIFAATTNSGNNWQCRGLGCCPPQQSYWEIVFFNANTGYGLWIGWIWPGLPATEVRKTTNSGQNWDIIVGGWSENMFFLNINTGYFTSGNIFLKTTNAGSNWSSYQISSNNNMYYKIMNFVNEMVGYLFPPSYYLNIMKTTNGGINWIQYDTGLGTELLDGYFVNELTGYSTSHNSYIFKTTNGGMNWYTQHYVYNSPDLYKILMINVNTGYAIGGNGIILKTTNGGEPLGIQPISNNVPTQIKLFQNYPNPFNPNTKIRFDISLDWKNQASNVIIIIYDIAGHEVSKLVNEQLKPGSYEVEWEGSHYPSGAYYYRLIVGDFIETKKMIFVK